MIPTIEQLEQVAAAAWDGSGIYTGFHSFWNAPAAKAIRKWEEIRPKEDAAQLQRTNHALAEELAAVKVQRQQVNISMSAVVAEKVAEIARLTERVTELNGENDRLKAAAAESDDWRQRLMNLGGDFNRRGTELLEAKREVAGLKTSLKDCLSFPQLQDCRAVLDKAGVPSLHGCIGAMARKPLLLRERIQCLVEDRDRLSALVPAPLSFGEPPAGWEWWNPGNLTPEQVGVAAGWRLMCKGESTKEVIEYRGGGRWQESAWQGSTAGNKSGQNGASLRTKAPLPAPKPTAEELERAELEAAWAEHSGYAPHGSGYIDFSTGWKAARAAKGGSEV